MTTGTAAQGLVTSVSTIASSTSGVASFPVVVTVTGSPTGFYSGGSAQVLITYKQLTNVLEVPTAAVTTSNGTSTVTVVAATGTHSTREVTTGLTSRGETQIVSGLAENEQVLVVTAATRTTATTGTGGTTFTGGSGTGSGRTGVTTTTTGAGQ